MWHSWRGIETQWNAKDYTLTLWSQSVTKMGPFWVELKKHRRRQQHWSFGSISVERTSTAGSSKEAEHIPGKGQEWGKVKVESRMFWVQLSNRLLHSFVTCYRQYQKWIYLRGQRFELPTRLVWKQVEPKIRSQGDKMLDFQRRQQQWLSFMSFMIMPEQVYKSRRYWKKKTSQDLKS